jgi:F-type H+-transporting ATPase subunit b
MEIVENIALITINETLIFQLVSFLLFLFILNRIMIRPLRNTMMERDTYLEMIEQEIVSADQSYQDIAHKIHKEESLARKTAFQQRDHLETEGQKTASELIEKTKNEISTMRIKSQQKTNAAIEVVRQEIRKDVETIADQMIAALLGQRSSS